MVSNHVLRIVCVCVCVFGAELPYTLEVPSHGVMVVHAGLVPGRALEAQSPREMTKMRDVVTVGVRRLRHKN